MPEHIGIKDLAARKRALVEESEAQRELLVDELYNLRQSAVVLQRRLKMMSTAASVLGLAGPLVGSLWRFRRAAEPVARGAVKMATKKGILGTVLMGWRMYRKVAPVLQAFMARR